MGEFEAGERLDVNKIKAKTGKKVTELRLLSSTVHFTKKNKFELMDKISETILVVKSTICADTAYICSMQSFRSVNPGLHQCN